MSLDANVLPGVLAALKTVQASVPSGSPTPPGTLRSIHYGEEFRVAGRGPVAWVVVSTADFPEQQGTDTEQSDWVVEARLLYQFTPDQRTSESVLASLIEPVRQAFRSHLKLQFPASGSVPALNNYGTSIPSPIARARVRSATWAYAEVNKVIYRMVTVVIFVREKTNANFNA